MASREEIWEKEKRKKLAKAKKRVHKKKEFYQHLTSYLIMSVFFFVLNVTTAFGHWWFYWPIMGWGIGILFHYFDAFGYPGVGPISKEWEEKAIQEEMEKMEQEEEFFLRKRETDNDHLELKELKKEKAERRAEWDDKDLV